MTTAEERRTRRAARTRRDIIEAGAVLFERHGVMRTTVEQIAELAEVSPATAYAVAGGKSGVLSALMEQWADAAGAIEVEDALARCVSPVEVVEALGAASAQVQSAHGRTMRIALATAPHDDGARAALDAATRRYRTTLRRVAERIVELDPDSGADPDAVAETLWFHFGYGGWGTVRSDFGWPVERARDWLVAHAVAALRCG